MAPLLHDTQRILPIGMAPIMGECPQGAGQRVSLSPTQHVAAGRPSLPQAYRLVLAL